MPEHVLLNEFLLKYGQFYANARVRRQDKPLE